MGDSFGCRRIGHEPALIEQQHPLEILDQRQVVADDDNALRQLCDGLLHQRSVFEIELVGRFVKYQDVGAGDQHRAERRHLQFAA